MSYDLKVPDPGTKPFWLAVDQSWSVGWHATVNGKALPAPQVIDGYGNGWLIDPATYGAGPIVVHVAWQPQSVVWVALIISAIGRGGGAGVLVVCGVARVGAGPADSWPLGADAPRPGRAGAARCPPTMFGVVGARLSTTAAVAIAIGFALFVALTTPWHGWSVPGLVLVVAATVVGDLPLAPGPGRGRPHGRAPAWRLAALYTVQAQFRHPNPADFQWALQFDKVNVLGLAAIFLLLVEGVRELLVRRRPPDPAPHDAGQAPRRSSPRRLGLAQSIGGRRSGDRACARTGPAWRPGGAGGRPRDPVRWPAGVGVRRGPRPAPRPGAGSRPALRLRVWDRFVVGHHPHVGAEPGQQPGPLRARSATASAGHVEAQLDPGVRAVGVLAARAAAGAEPHRELVERDGAGGRHLEDCVRGRQHGNDRALHWERRHAGHPGECEQVGLVCGVVTAPIDSPRPVVLIHGFASSAVPDLGRERLAGPVGRRRTPGGGHRPARPRPRPTKNLHDPEAYEAELEELALA